MYLIILCVCGTRNFAMPAVLLPLLSSLLAVNLNHAKAASHASLVELVRSRLVNVRTLPPEAVHVEAEMRRLPAHYGLPSSPPHGLLSPDIVALDEREDELLVIECTICPDQALSRYVHRKTNKYRYACKQAGAAPPLVVAIGTGGRVPASTRKRSPPLMVRRARPTLWTR